MVSRLRKLLLTRLGRRLPMQPEPVPPLARLGEKWREAFGRTRLSLYTTPTIGVVARKPAVADGEVGAPGAEVRP